MLRTFDPASDDPTILGKRERALSQVELQRLLPLLTYPALACLGMRLATERDYRPIALRFQLLTAARIDEVASMRWRDFKDATRSWHKREIKSVGEKTSREQYLELSGAAVRLLESLPGHGMADPQDLVFPNAAAAKLGNWTRITRALHRESGTTGWHRHDLRRTAASIMRAVGVTLPVIDGILGHKAGKVPDGVSAAVANYVVPMEIQIAVPHPQRDALDLLAGTLAAFEEGNA